MTSRWYTDFRPKVGQPGVIGQPVKKTLMEPVDQFADSQPLTSGAVSSGIPLIGSI